MTVLLETPLLPLFFFISSLLLTACSSAFTHLGPFKSKEWIRSYPPSRFFFLPILRKCFPKREWDALQGSLSLSKHLVQLSFAVTALLYVVDTYSKRHLSAPVNEWRFLAFSAAIVGISLGAHWAIRLIAKAWSRGILRFIAPLVSLILLLLFPLVGPLLQLTGFLLRKALLAEESSKPLVDKAKLREMIAESELHSHLDASDQKLISSLITFKQRVAKEIMVPRVNLYALESDITIRAATTLFASEGYSRIPIYKESLDDITGVILYKDLLKCYANPQANLDAPLQSIAKPVLYAPENKKITHLLQEFRTQQIHMAIIVDEYGGTEGVVTIEDILEELVGNIEDEFDVTEEPQYWEVSEGGWVVDAKMTLLDIEDQLGIKIPPSPEYETIGGYIFHYAGTIPSAGWHLSHDKFDLEILSSDERSIKKIKICPR